MRARPGELNVSWDRVDDQSQIDRSIGHGFADRRRAYTYSRGHTATISSHKARPTATRAFKIPTRIAN
jgi:hypothetical protein